MISYVQITNAKFVSPQSSLSVSFSQGIAAGSIIVICGNFQDNASSVTISNDKNDTVVDSGIGILHSNINHDYTFIKAFFNSTAGASTITATYNGGTPTFGFLVVYEISGLSQSIFDRTSNAAGTATNAITGLVSPTVKNEATVACFSGSVSGPTPGVGWLTGQGSVVGTNLGDGNFGGGAISEHAIVTSLASFQGLATYPSSANFTGVIATIMNNYSLTATKGTYTYTGNIAGIARGNSMLAAFGVYSNILPNNFTILTYQQRLSSSNFFGISSNPISVASISGARTPLTILPASRGTYQLIGIDNSFIKTNPPIVGTFMGISTAPLSGTVISGARLDNQNNQILIANGTTYVYIGDISFSDRVVLIQTQSYGIAGQNVQLVYKTINATKGVYFVTGQVANLGKGYKFLVSSGTYTLSGINASFSLNTKVLQALKGSYVITGNVINTPTTRKLIASQAVYVDSGRIANLARQLVLQNNLSHGVYTYIGNANVKLQHSYKPALASGNYVLIGFSVFSGSTLVATSGTYNITGQQSNRFKNALLIMSISSASIGSFGISSTQPLNGPIALIVTSGNYVYNGDQSMSDHIWQVSAGAYILSGVDANLIKTTSTAVRTIVGGISAIAIGGASISGKETTYGSLTYTIADDFTSYSINGKLASLIKQYKVVASPSSYTLSGKNIVPKASRIVSLTQGSYNLTGVASTSRHGYSIVSTKGTYTYTGNIIQVKKNNIMSLGPSPYQILGSIAVFKRGYVFSVSSGIYVTHGVDTAYNVKSGAYSITGNVQKLLYGRVFSVNSGSYALTGNAATLVAIRNSAIFSGVYVLTGRVVTFLNAKHSLSASVGQYRLVGMQASLLSQHQFAVIGGSSLLTASGGITTLTATRTLAASAGTYAITGRTIIITKMKRVAVSLGSYALTYSQTGKVSTTIFNVSFGTYALSGKIAVISTVRSTLGQAYNIIGKTTRLAYNHQLNAQTGFIFVSTTSIPITTITKAFNLRIQTANYNIIGHALPPHATRVMILDTAAYAVIGRSAGLKYSHNLGIVSTIYNVVGKAVNMIRLAFLKLGFGHITYTGVKDRVLPSDTRNYSIVWLNQGDIRRIRHIRVKLIYSHTNNFLSAKQIKKRKRV